MVPKTTIQLQAEIERLAILYRPPDSAKFMPAMGRMFRIKKFYEKKCKVAPDKQAVMFRSFASTLHFAMNILSRYDELTLIIAELAKEDDETRTNS